MVVFAQKEFEDFLLEILWLLVLMLCENERSWRVGLRHNDRKRSVYLEKNPERAKELAKELAPRSRLFGSSYYRDPNVFFKSH